MAQLQPQVKQQFFGNDGLPLVGGKVYTYLGGTTTPKATFSDPEGLAPNPNPVILDARGEALIFWTGTYKVKLTDALDNPIYTVDNVQEVSPAYRTSATGSLITPAGTTAQRDTTPVVGYARWNTSLGVFEIWNGAIWQNAFVGSGAASGPGGSPLGYRNKIIGGDCRIARRGNTAAAATLTYGGADNILVAVGNLTGGTISRFSTGPSIGVCGYSQVVTNTNTTGSNDVIFETRIESRDTINLGGKQVTISASVYQDTGISILATVRLAKASAVDNFTTRNIIQDSVAQVIPSGVLTRVTFTTNALAAADTLNGLAASVFLSFIGAVANKNFGITDWQLEEGDVATPFEVKPFAIEQALCARYLPSFVGSQATYQPLCSALAISPTQSVACLPLPVPARVAPTGAVVASAGNYSIMNGVGTVNSITGLAFSTASPDAVNLLVTSAAGSPTLTAGQAGTFGSNGGSSSQLYLTGCQL